MRVQTGIDIIEVSRIEETIKMQGEKFLTRIFTPNEIIYCSQTKKMQYQHYAARFAAKEAIFKAISNEIMPVTGEVWNKIEIIHSKDGKPVADLSAFQLPNIISQDLSLSHLKEYAVASFTILFET